MFAKLSFLIVSVGIVGGVLMCNRANRNQIANQTAKVTIRVGEHDRTLLRLRSEIASRVTPDKIEVRALALGPLRPISPERYTELVRLETLAAEKTAITVSPADESDVPTSR